MPLLCTIGAATARAFGGRATVAEAPTDFYTLVEEPQFTYQQTYSSSLIPFGIHFNYVTGPLITALVLQVKFNNGTYVEWDRQEGLSTTSQNGVVEFNSEDTGWSGMGTYTFRALARRASSGVFDLVSSTCVFTYTS